MAIPSHSLSTEKAAGLAVDNELKIDEILLGIEMRAISLDYQGLDSIKAFSKRSLEGNPG